MYILLFVATFPFATKWKSLKVYEIYVLHILFCICGRKHNEKKNQNITEVWQLVSIWRCFWNYYQSIKTNDFGEHHISRQAIRGWRELASRSKALSLSFNGNYLIYFPY